ncbi:hypothetical protein COCOBI_03-1110 [Coccomyxa sp. Obi]|nr:hypothetical protein COCOBI_03-1110 [Coccomyxa sp. Obi]
MLASSTLPRNGRFCSACECFRKNVAIGVCTGRRPFIINVRRSEGGGNKDDKSNPRSRKGSSYENKNRRRGRPAWQRSADDTPLRDGNRDRLIGLLTERAARTLLYYLSETNQHLYYWFSIYIRDNPIPRNGHWDDVSGETFLRNLLSRGIEKAQYTLGHGEMYDHFGACGVDPRNIAQRVMDIRTQIAKEMVQDLGNIAEENSLLMRETLFLAFNLDNVVDHPLSQEEGTPTGDSHDDSLQP